MRLDRTAIGSPSAQRMRVEMVAVPSLPPRVLNVLGVGLTVQDGNWRSCGRPRTGPTGATVLGRWTRMGDDRSHARRRLTRPRSTR